MELSPELVHIMGKIRLQGSHLFGLSRVADFNISKLLFTCQMQVQPQFMWTTDDKDIELTILKSSLSLSTIKILSKRKNTVYPQLGHPLLPYLKKGLQVAIHHPQILDWIIENNSKEVKAITSFKSLRGNSEGFAEV